MQSRVLKETAERLEAKYCPDAPFAWALRKEIVTSEQRGADWHGDLFAQSAVARHFSDGKHDFAESASQFWADPILFAVRATLRRVTIVLIALGFVVVFFGIVSAIVTDDCDSLYMMGSGGCSCFGMKIDTSSPAARTSDIVPYTTRCAGIILHRRPFQSSFPSVPNHQ